MAEVDVMSQEEDEEQLTHVLLLAVAVQSLVSCDTHTHTHTHTFTMGLAKLLNRIIQSPIILSCNTTLAAGCKHTRATITKTSHPSHAATICAADMCDAAPFCEGQVSAGHIQTTSTTTVCHGPHRDEDCSTVAL